jgi:hypothetical protein
MIYGANNFAKCSFEVFMNASCNFLATFKPLRSRVLSIVRVLFSVVVVCCKTKEEIDLCITGRCYPLKHIIMHLGTFLVLIVFNATFNNNFSYIVENSFIGEGNPEYPMKTTDLPQVTDKLHYILLYRVHLTFAGFKLTMLVVIGTDWMGSYRSNYETIMTTTAPILTIKKCFLT